MGITKKSIHSQDQIEIAKLFKALGHPARIAIVEALLIHKNLNCTDLKFYISLSQSTISTHLKELHEVGILSLRNEKNCAYYEVNKLVLEQITDYLNQVYKQIDKKNYNLINNFFNPYRKIIHKNFQNNSC